MNGIFGPTRYNVHIVPVLVGAQDLHAGYRDVQKVTLHLSAHAQMAHPNRPSYRGLFPTDGLLPPDHYRADHDTDKTIHAILKPWAIKHARALLLHRDLWSVKRFDE